ncbi:hypothetical protein OSCI_2140002 [Kamptonema sp. PCC 6506]|nr:hypothetical protein OSCI_2140002 [Kamptonema sp. PCC 6506]
MQTKPADEGFKTLNVFPVRAGGLRLCSREFYSPGLFVWTYSPGLIFIVSLIFFYNNLYKPVSANFLLLVTKETCRNYLVVRNRSNKM